MRPASRETEEREIEERERVSAVLAWDRGLREARTVRESLRNVKDVHFLSNTISSSACPD
jgi:hypothetical protein